MKNLKIPSLLALTTTLLLGSTSVSATEETTAPGDEGRQSPHLTQVVPVVDDDSETQKLLGTVETLGFDSERPNITGDGTAALEKQTSAASYGKATPVEAVYGISDLLASSVPQGHSSLFEPPVHAGSEIRRVESTELIAAYRQPSSFAPHVGDDEETPVQAFTAFRASGNPDLLLTELGAYFDGLTTDTTVTNALNTFLNTSARLYAATGAEDPTCKNGMDANITGLYQYLAGERDVAAALAHIKGLEDQHQTLLGVFSIKESTDESALLVARHTSAEPALPASPTPDVSSVNPFEEEYKPSDE